MSQHSRCKSIIQVRIGEATPIENDSPKQEAANFINFLRLRKIGDLNRIRAMMAQISMPLEVRAEVLAGLGQSIIDGGVDD
jgi:hypothetical protein